MNPAKLGGRALLAVSLACAFSFWGCLFQDDRRAGGTIETTNGVVAARVVLPNGSAASNVKVYLLDEKEWLTKVKSGASIYLDSAETDGEGGFKIKKDTAIHASLVANVQDYGILIRNVTPEMIKTDYAGIIGLRRHKAYRGVVVDSNAVPNQVLLAGTPYVSTVDSATGEFSFQDLPPESYPVVVRRQLPDDSYEYAVAGDVDLSTNDSIPADTLVPDTSKILVLDDFDDSDNRTKLGPILGDGYWIAYDDSILGGNSRLYQPVNAAPQNFEAAVQDGGGTHKTALQVLYKTGDTAGVEKPYSYVFVEVNLGGSSGGLLKHYNLGALDTLSFFAKGNGKVVMELVQNQYGIPLFVTASFTVNLTEAWQEFKITPDQLVISVSNFPANPSDFSQALQDSHLPLYTSKPQTWAETGGMFRTIRFLGTGGSEFWLDLIRLHGITLGDLVK
jgi:hypothetical protein